ncbi:hypothetical protein ACT1UH_01930 [Mycoplasma sp. 332]|uniref:hypothetical protein n=1 Tax=Mycoplasma sp. 332 TaxID=3458236 RepID=UPI0040363F2C
MKFKLSPLLSAVIIAATPLVISAQNNMANNIDKEEKNSSNNVSVYATEAISIPTNDDYNDVESYNIYWKTEAFKTHYKMLFAYRVLKKLINFQGEKLDILPYKEKLMEFKIFPDGVFDNFNNEYFFYDHNLLHWATFIKLWSDVNFDYNVFLLNEYKKLNIDSVYKVADDLRSNVTSGKFSSKISDIYIVQTIIAHFEAINLLIKHKENSNIKNLIKDLFKVQSGINSADPAYLNTLKDSLPILEKIKKEANDSIIEEIIKEVESEFSHDKLMYDALISAQKSYGSIEYDEKIKPLVKLVSNSSTMEFLENLKNSANNIYLSEKQKVDMTFEDLRNKDPNIKEKINKARNVGILRELYADIMAKKIQEYQNDVMILIEKTKGSSMYDDFMRTFSTIKEKNEQQIEQRKVAIEAFDKKWKDFGRNHTKINIDIKKEKDELNTKLSSQIENQRITIEQFNDLNDKSTNLFSDENNKTKLLINSINSVDLRTKKLEELKKAKNIEDLQKLIVEAQKIKNVEDLTKAREEATKALKKIEGSVNYEEYKKQHSEAQDDIIKLTKLADKINAEYKLKRNEVEKNLKSLDDKTGFEQALEEADNIQKLNKLNEALLNQIKEQDLNKLIKRAQKAVDQTEGSERFEEFKTLFANAKNDVVKLTNVAEKAEEIYNIEKQKILDTFNKLLDKKDYQTKINNANNIKNLKILLKEITQEKILQENAQIKKEANDAIDRLEGSELKKQLGRELSNNKENTNKIKDIAAKATQEFNMELNSTKEELNKLTNSNTKKELEKLIENAQNIKELRIIKLKIQKAITEQETKSKKEGKSKINVAAIVGPLVVILALAGASVGTWYAVKRHKIQKRKEINKN